MPTHFTRRSLIVFFALLIVISLGGIGVWTYVARPQFKGPQSPSGAPADQSGETQNWRRFSHSVIEFDYPPGWKVARIYEGEGKPPVVEIRLSDTVTDESRGVFGLLPLGMLEGARTLDERVADTEKILTGPSRKKISNKQTLTISGHRAIRFDTEFYGQSGQLLYGSHIFLETNAYAIDGQFFGSKNLYIDAIHRMYDSIKLK